MNNKVIYKFFRVNEFLYDTLISNQLFFSSINQFNDPYDCHLKYDTNTSLETIDRFIGNKLFTLEEKKRHIEIFQKDPSKYMQPLYDGFREMLSYYGICSFGNTKTNMLLWSHYADNHRGIALGFDYGYMSDQFKQISEVDYSNEPYTFDINDVNASISKTVLRKSTDWKYEEEIRIIMERSKNVAFNKQALVEVNFGTRCPKRTMINFYHLIFKLGYTNCKFFQAKTNESEYSFLFDEVDFVELKDEMNQEFEERKFNKIIELKHLFDM